MKKQSTALVLAALMAALTAPAFAQNTTGFLKRVRSAP